MNLINLILLTASSLTLSVAAPVRKHGSSKTCTVDHNGDDSLNLLKAVKSCGNDSNIVFEKGTTYDFLTPVSLKNLQNVTFSFQGNMSINSNKTYVLGLKVTQWFYFEGSSVHLEGSTDEQWGWFDGHGQQYWDMMNLTSPTLDDRPTVLEFGLKDSTLNNIKIYNPPSYNIMIDSNSNNVHISNTTLISRTTGSFPFNTDGIDIGGKNILVEKSHIENGDDCCTLRDGAANITFRDATCIGGHGISIGSLGKNASSFATIYNYTAENVYVKDSLYGARFKAWVGATGSVQNVTYRNFVTENCTIPIFLTQTYTLQGTNTTRSYNSSDYISLENFVFQNFTGSVDGKTQKAGIDGSGSWWAVEGVTGRDGIVMECPSKEACSGVHFDDITFFTNFKNSTDFEVWCQNGSNNTLGFECVNGTYVPTSSNSSSTAGWCVVDHSDGQDDTTNLLRAVSICGNHSTIEFAEGVTYNMWSPVKLSNLHDVEFVVNGNLSLPTNMSRVLSIASSQWFYFLGTNVSLQGSRNDSWGWIEGYGEQYWAKMSPSNSTLNGRPAMIRLGLQNSTVDRIKISQPPKSNIVTESSCKNVAITNTKIIAKSGNGYFPFNTDGFDANGDNISITHSYVENGDDCIAVQSGASNVLFQHAVCIGGHGVSIGSLGKSPTKPDYVTNFTAEDIYVKDSLYGGRFKAWIGGQGLVKNVAYRNFIVDNCTIPIFVTQSYFDQGSSASRGSYNTTDYIAFENFKFENFYGSIMSEVQYAQKDPSGTWWAVQGLTGRDAIVLMCPSIGACEGISVENVDFRANYNGSTDVDVWCQYGVDVDLGFHCVNGTYSPVW